MRHVEVPWRWRDTLALIVLLGWGAGWTAFGLAHLVEGPVIVRRTLLDLFALSVGLAALYIAIGVLVIRLWEVMRLTSRERT